MILSTLDQSARYEALHPLFKPFFDYVKAHDLLHEAPGRISLDGDRLYINNVCADLKAAADQVLEVHRDYLDIHVVLEGEERFGWLPLAEAADERQPFDPATDCALYGDRPASWLTLRPGDFVIVYPEDAHAPIVGDGGQVRKLIGKVRLVP